MTRHYTFLLCLAGALLIVHLTGGGESPFSFLFYFVIFSAGIFLTARASLLYTAVIIIYSIVSYGTLLSPKALITIFSFLLAWVLTVFIRERLKEEEKRRVDSLSEAAARLKKDAREYLFLLIRHHLKNIRKAADNFMGDHQLSRIKKAITHLEDLIKTLENK